MSPQQTPDEARRWRRVEEICDAALKLAHPERDAYLAVACGADDALRREVAALLVHENTSQGFLSAPIGAVAAQVLEPPRDLIGTRIGDYDIVAKLGEGGMGEVYRARDRKLGRDVAIKVLPAAVANDQERLKRFEREARLLASVNHPSIGAIYGLAEAGDLRALVLELVEGQTLAAMLERGPIKLDRALSIAAQICDALDHAHRRGITHRDLKPSNLMLIAGGIKLLDFGIGKWSPAGSDVTVAPASTLTGEGAIIGTVHYMSPEQLEGRQADARSDIFAFGAVLYEMISGTKAFDGKSQAGIIAAVLEAPTPKLTGLASPRLERVVTKCLAKSPDERWQSAHDLADELRWLLAEATVAPGTAAMHSSKPRRPVAIAAGLAALAAVFLLGYASNLSTPVGSSPAATIRFSVQPQDSRLETGVFDISNDGGQLIYSSINPALGRMLHVRRLDSFDAVRSPVFDRALSHVFSPDGQWVAFVARGVLRKMRVGSEAAPDIVQEGIDPIIEMAWPTADSIFIVGRNQPIRRVPANGGVPEAITTIQPGTEVDHHGPELLPSGNALLFAIHGQRNRFSIAVQDLRSGARKTLIESGFAPHYSSTGHLVFGRGSAIMAVPFDEERLEVFGDPVVLIEHVSNEARSGWVDFQLSTTGTAAYMPEQQTDGRLLKWVDRSGRETAVAVPARSFETPRVSPDGNQLAFVVRDGSGRRDVWILEIASGRLARLTEDGDNSFPLWMPDGSGLLYSHDIGAASRIVRHRFNSATLETLGTSDDNDLWATAIAGDDRVLVTVQPPTDEMYLAQLVGGSLAPQLLLKTPGYPRAARLSPDGRWLAYGEFVSGRPEVFIQGYPDAGLRRQVSVDGGRAPIWSRDGKELLFRGTGRMFAVSIETKSGLQWGRPRLLFQDNHVAAALDYDVAPDGRFVMITPAPAEGAAAQINVIVNWRNELLARVPVKR